MHGRTTIYTMWFKYVVIMFECNVLFTEQLSFTVLHYLMLIYSIYAFCIKNFVKISCVVFTLSTRAQASRVAGV